MVWQNRPSYTYARGVYWMALVRSFKIVKICKTFLSFKLWIAKASGLNSNHFQKQTTKPERIYNSITTMGFSAMFTFHLDNTNNAGTPLQ